MLFSNHSNSRFTSTVSVRAAWQTISEVMSWCCKNPECYQRPALRHCYDSLSIFSPSLFVFASAACNESDRGRNWNSFVLPQRVRWVRTQVVLRNSPFLLSGEKIYDFLALWLSLSPPTQMKELTEETQVHTATALQRQSSGMLGDVGSDLRRKNEKKWRISSYLINLRQIHVIQITAHCLKIKYRSY